MKTLYNFISLIFSWYYPKNYSFVVLPIPIRDYFVIHYSISLFLCFYVRLVFAGCRGKSYHLLIQFVLDCLYPFNFLYSAIENLFARPQLKTYAKV